MTKRGRGRPPLPEDERRVKFTATILPETQQRIAELAGEMDISQSKVVDRAVAAFKPRK